MDSDKGITMRKVLPPPEGSRQVIPAVLLDSPASGTRASPFLGLQVNEPVPQVFLYAPNFT